MTSLPIRCGACASDRSFQAMTHFAPGAILLITHDGYVRNINPMGCKLFEIEKEKAVGKHLTEIWEGKGIAEVDQLLQDFNKEKKVHSLIELTSSDGKQKILLAEMFHCQEHCNDMQCLIATFSNVTALKKNNQLEAANADLAKEIAEKNEIEKQLKRSTEEAESASLAKSEFLANMSHEIRTPMNSVLGFINLLLSTSLTDKQIDYAQTVKSSGSLLLALIDDILDLSKIEANKLILEKIPFSFGKMLKETVKLFEPKAAEKGIMMSLELDSYLLETEVSGDCQRVRQLMINLIGNALKFTREGYVKIKVNNHLSENNTLFIDVSIEDTGIGISQNDLPKIFGKFTQANSGTTRKFGGTGLGLAISKKLVTLMGGTLGCCSTPGKGSEFFFHLPFEVPPGLTKDCNEVTFAPGAISKPEITPSEISILIVEDDAASRKFAEQCLENNGYKHTSIDNGFKATETLNLVKFDLVIMDWCLPGWSGLLIAEQLRKNQGPNQHVPIIAVTARAMKGDRETCLKSGMNSYLSKPFSPEDLLREISKLLIMKHQS